MSKGEESENHGQVLKEQVGKPTEDAEDVFKRNLSKSLLEIDQDHRVAVFFSVASWIGSFLTLMVSQIQLMFSAFSQFAQYFTIVGMLVFIIALCNLMRNLQPAPYRFFLRRNKTMQEGLISMFDSNWRMTSVEPSKGNRFENYSKRLHKSVLIWANWRIKKTRYFNIFILYFLVLLLIYALFFKGIQLPDMPTIGTLIILIIGPPFYLVYLFIFQYYSSNFNQIQLGREIFQDFAWRFLYEEVRLPLEEFVRSNTRGINKEKILVPINNWDKFYRQSYFSDEKLNAFLRTFHAALFPLPTKEYYLTLFLDVKTRLQSIKHQNSLEGIKDKDPADEADQIISLLDIYLENLKASSELIKEGEQHKWERGSFWVSISLSILALIISIFFRGS